MLRRNQPPFTMLTITRIAVASILTVLVTLVALAPSSLSAKDGDPASATKDAPFINSLGMEFVPVPGTKVLFCRTETRVRDFEACVKDIGYKQDSGMFVIRIEEQKNTHSFGVKYDDKANWREPGFEQGRDHPVVGVNWNEARSFCAWLSLKEGKKYRLPTDEEWSAAAGLGKYPWGSAWPPPKNSGNYHDETLEKTLPKLDWKGLLKNEQTLHDYNDGEAHTAPVASYMENRLGIYDLGGNVSEWCEDEYKDSMNTPDVLKIIGLKKKETDGTVSRVLRGGSWKDQYPFSMRSSYRQRNYSGSRISTAGFRCVLVVSD